MVVCMQDLTDYKVDRLFILVGGNPLPSYVAGRLLLHGGGILHLIYTTETEEFAKGLADALQTDLHQHGVALEDKSRDPGAIFRRVSRKLRNIPQGLTIGLNYTGGTKVMAVHSYRAVLLHTPQAICSYIDPDRLELRLERNGDDYGTPVRLLPREMQAAIGLNLQQLWRMHRREPLPPEHPQYSERTQPYFVRVPQLLAKRIADGERQRWNDTFNGSAKRGITPIRDRDPLENLPFPEVVTAIRDEQPQIRTYGQLQAFLGTRWNSWLAGGDWLEDLVLNCLNQLSTDLGLRDVTCSAATIKQSDGRQMELDVVAVRGYQLFLFSCYVGNSKDVCKEKLFEVSHRAEQLGGSEARFALVCGHENKEELRQEMTGLLPGFHDTMRRDMTGLHRRFEVFDRSDLPKLCDALREWIRRVDKEHS